MLEAGFTFLTVVGGFAVTCFLIIVTCAVWMEVRDRRASKDELAQRRAAKIDVDNEKMKRLDHLVKARQDVWLRAGREGWTPRLSAAWKVLHEMIEEERAS
jgi:hypothetical protein